MFELFDDYMWFGDHGFPAEKFDEYDSYVEDMRRHSAKNGNLLYLRFFLESVLNHKEGAGHLLEEVSGECWGFDADDLREILRYAYDFIWQDIDVISHKRIPKITLINMGRTTDALMGWESVKNIHNPGFDESKIEYMV